MNAPLTPTPSRPTSTRRCSRSGKDTTHLPQDHRPTACGSRRSWAATCWWSSARRCARWPRPPSSTSTICCAPAHLAQLQAILDDPEASDNDKFVAYDFLKNANIAAGGVLPMCQDTGTAIIMGKKGRLVFTDGDDEAALAEGARDAYLKKQPALFAARAALDVRGEEHRATTCRRRSRSTPRARTPTSSCSSPRAAARPTRRSCSRRRRRS